MQKKIGILASSDGKNLPSLLQAIQNGVINASIGLIISNRPNSSVINLAERFGIESLLIKPDLFNSKEEYDLRLAKEFWTRQIDLIALCGYTRALSLSILKVYNQRIISIHPSLLPAFSGIGMFGSSVHKSVLQRGVKFSGCTVHVVEEEIGYGKILAQNICELNDFETEESIKNKVFQLEEKIYPESVSKYLNALAPLNFNELPYALAETGNINYANNQSSTENNPYFDDKQKEFHFAKPNFKGYALCDVGLKRKENADTVILTPDLKIMGVADGVGSAKEGKQTSRMIISFLEKKWQNEGINARLKSLDHGAWLRKTVIEANNQILNWAKNSISKVDIGSTLVVGIFDEENKDIYISNTGDSRCYLWRNNIMYRLTRDHSEDFDPESGEGGALLFFMGGKQGLFGLDLFQLRLYPQDRVLFCSDGLLYATESVIAQRFQEKLEIKEFGKKLLEDAFAVGAPDNTSIVLFEYE